MISYYMVIVHDRNLHSSLTRQDSGKTFLYFITLHYSRGKKYLIQKKSGNANQKKNRV